MNNFICHFEYKFLDKWYDGDFYRRNIKGEMERIPILETTSSEIEDIFTTINGLNNGISEPRGIPENCCIETQEDYDGYGDKIKKASYLTLEDLRKWDNDNHGEIVMTGISDVKSVEIYEQTGKLPKRMYGWSNFNDTAKFHFRRPALELRALISEMAMRFHKVCWFSPEVPLTMTRIVFWYI